MDRLHSCFIDVWFSTEKECSDSEVYVYLECSYSTKTIGYERSRGYKRSPCSSPLHTYIPFQPNKTKWLRFVLLFNQTKKWSGFILIIKHRMKLLYSHKLERSRSLSNWLTNQPNAPTSLRTIRTCMPTLGAEQLREVEVPPSSMSAKPQRDQIDYRCTHVWAWLYYYIDMLLYARQLAYC